MEVSQKCCIFASKTTFIIMNKEESLRAHATQNLPCFIHACPLHASCLHWMTGQYYDNPSHIVTSINPSYPSACTEQCGMYQKDDVVRYAFGTMHLFDAVRYPIARNVKKRLIALFTRKRFYEYRNSTRPIPPHAHEQIARVFHEEGWDGEIRYDDWKEDFLW